MVVLLRILLKSVIGVERRSIGEDLFVSSEGLITFNVGKAREPLPFPVVSVRTLFPPRLMLPVALLEVVKPIRLVTVPFPEPTLTVPEVIIEMRRDLSIGTI